MKPTHLVRYEAQQEASRQNSKLSTGPRTATGKANSCLNAYKHGFTSKRLPSLSPQMMEYLSEIHRGYQREFDPVGQYEIDLVRQIADAVFTMRHLQHSLDSVVELEIKDIRPRYEKRYPGLSTDQQTALAYRCLSERPALPLFLRYNAGAERTFHRAMKALRLAQKERFSAERDEQVEPAQSGREKLGFVRQNLNCTAPQPDDTASPDEETAPRTTRK